MTQSDSSQFNQMIAELSLEHTLQNLQQQMTLHYQAVQVLTDEVKLLMQQSNKPHISGYALLLQQLERGLTYTIIQKLFHKIILLWKNWL